MIFPFPSLFLCPRSVGIALNFRIPPWHRSISDFRKIGPPSLLATMPILQCPRIAFSLWINTISPIVMFRCTKCHFCLMTRWGKTSLCHFFQNDSTMLCRKSKRCVVVHLSRKGPCGICGVDLPSRRSLGQRYGQSSGNNIWAPRGRWFINWFISKNTVSNSLNVRTCSTIADERFRFAVLTNASMAPFIHGASAGENFPVVLYRALYSFSSFQSNPSITSCSSLDAATSWDPL